MTEATTDITNRLGFHVRPASMFVKLAAKFKSKVQLKAKGKTVDAKSILMLMSMGLVQGTEVTICADGPDEKEAVAVLKKFIDDEYSFQPFPELELPTAEDDNEPEPEPSPKIEDEVDAIDFYQRGCAMQQRNNFNLAIEDFDEAIKRNPTFAEAYYNRGLCRQKTGNLAAAIEDFNEAIKLTERQAAEAYYQRGLCYEQMSKQMNRQAEADFEKAKKPGYKSLVTLLALKAENFSQQRDEISS